MSLRSARTNLQRKLWAKKGPKTRLIKVIFDT